MRISSCSSAWVRGKARGRGRDLVLLLGLEDAGEARVRGRGMG